MFRRSRRLPQLSEKQVYADYEKAYETYNRKKNPRKESEHSSDERAEKREKKPGESSKNPVINSANVDTDPSTLAAGMYLSEDEKTGWELFDNLSPYLNKEGAKKMQSALHYGRFFTEYNDGGKSNGANNIDDQLHKIRMLSQWANTDSSGIQTKLKAVNAASSAFEGKENNPFSALSAMGMLGNNSGSGGGLNPMMLMNLLNGNQKDGGSTSKMGMNPMLLMSLMGGGGMGGLGAMGGMGKMAGGMGAGGMNPMMLMNLFGGANKGQSPKD